MKRHLVMLSLVLTVLPALALAGGEPAVPRLALQEITSEPFLISWHSTNTLSVGTNLLGLTVVNVENITEPYTTPEGETVTRDRPLAATLQRGNRTFKLYRGSQLLFIDWFALLKSRDDGKLFKTRVGDTFVLDQRTFRLLSVDTQAVTCVVAEIETGTLTTVGKEK